MRHSLDKGLLTKPNEMMDNNSTKVVCTFDYTAVAGSGKVGPVHQVNHTSWVAAITPTDRPKSVRNRCVIEHFCGVVCVVTLPF